MAALLLLSNIAKAQTKSLRECIEYAIENAHDTKIQEAKNSSKEAEYRKALLSFAPSVGGSVGLGSNFGRSIDPETNIYSNSTSFSNSYSLYGSLTIFDGFSLINSYKIGQINRLSGVEESTLIEDDISLRTIQAYLNVVYANAMVSLAESQTEESEALLERTKVMEEIGIRSSSDLLQAEAKLASDKYNQTLQKNRLAREILTLKTIMNYPAQLNLEIDYSTSHATLYEYSSQAEDSIVVSALANMPQIKIASLNLESARLRYSTAKWSTLPSIRVNGGYSTGYMKSNQSESVTPAFWDQIKNKQGQYLTLGISIPIFNSYNKRTEIIHSRNQYSIAEQEQKKSVAEIVSEVRKAVGEVNGAVMEVNLAQKRLHYQEIAHKANIRKYEEGLIGILELQTSSNLLLASKAELLNTSLKYRLSKSIVERFNGVEYRFQISL